MFKKILYIGAGLDFDPFSHFKDTKEFVFIDSNPRNAYGYPYYYRGFYCKHFLPQLKGKLVKLGFKLITKLTFTDNYSEILVDDLDSTLLEYKKDDITLKYYYSTGIPEDLWDNFDLQKDITECDTVLVCGHHPHKEFEEFIPKPFHFIGYNSTYFPNDYEEFIKEDEDNKRNIISYMLQNPKVVKDYTFMNKNGEMKTFDSYEKFYLEIQK